MRVALPVRSLFDIVVLCLLRMVYFCLVGSISVSVIVKYKRSYFVDVSLGLLHERTCYNISKEKNLNSLSMVVGSFVLV